MVGSLADPRRTERGRDPAAEPLRTLTDRARVVMGDYPRHRETGEGGPSGPPSQRSTVQQH